MKPYKLGGRRPPETRSPATSAKVHGADLKAADQQASRYSPSYHSFGTWFNAIAKHKAWAFGGHDPRAIASSVEGSHPGGISARAIVGSMGSAGSNRPSTNEEVFQ